MNTNTEADSWPKIVWHVFYLHTPLGKFVFAILAIVFAAFYFGLCKWPPIYSDACEGRVTLVGILRDAKTNRGLENVTVHLGTFAEDDLLVNGVFTVEGVTVPKSKIVPLTVEFSDGRRLLVKDFDLTNSTKYPVIDCRIDLLETLVNKDKGEVGQINPTTISSPDPRKSLPGHQGTASDLPPQAAATTTFFNDENLSQIAILATGQSGISTANLKNQLVQQLQTAGFSTSTSLFRPSFLTSFSRNLDDEDFAALKNAGVDQRTACLCFVRAGKVDFGKDKIEAGGETNGFENAHGSFEVKFFAFRSNVVRSFTIEETGAGGNQSRARESLEEKFMLQFSNKKLPFQLCKN